MNIKQHRFITEYLRFGDKAIAYKNAYNTPHANYRTLESAANRLLKKPEIAYAIEEAMARIRSEAEQELKQQLREELMSVQRKRDILARIAHGDVYIEQTYRGKGCQTCSVMVKPTINQMLKAIDLDSKLAGDYAVKKQLTVVHAVKATNLSSEVEKEIIHNVPLSEELGGGNNNDDFPQQNATTERQKERADEHAAEKTLINANIDSSHRHISHAGLRKLFETPVKQQKEAKTG
ncbi:MAG: terminase small subunit [Bacteroidetes bacterium]|nr:terminase small subunit [Bacteroidota bacterium]